MPNKTLWVCFLKNWFFKPGFHVHKLSLISVDILQKNAVSVQFPLFSAFSNFLHTQFQA